MAEAIFAADPAVPSILKICVDKAVAWTSSTGAYGAELWLVGGVIGKPQSAAHCKAIAAGLPGGTRLMIILMVVSYMLEICQNISAVASVAVASVINLGSCFCLLVNVVDTIEQS
ncbi:hypothetical protein [Sodalis sp.]|uniref:hypothetical protein n=1 Tax=Sodalis sp. (in: enterobacteria) TaxID=1898979 RepID=UPI0038732AE8